MSAIPSPADTDRNLLFGVLALQADLLDPPRFAEACAAWAARKDMPLADLLVERGWLTPADRASLEHLLQRKLEKHQGDAHLGLAVTITPEARQVLGESSDAALQEAARSLPPVPSLPGTVAHQPQSRDRYILLHLHAQGGIGQVWLARDDNLGREVALKELRPDRAGRPDLGHRFLTEAQVTGQLEHPGIVPVYDLVRPGGDSQPFYTMRFIRGRTLAEAVRAYHRRRRAGQAGPLELRELLGNFVAVCRTVAYAHARGVVHRDLKPSNVALGDYGEVMVLDWGLAKLLAAPVESPEEASRPSAPPVRLEGEGPSEAVTHAGQVMGTPAFMSPEQAQGRHDLVDARSDVYSLGAILYEILTGQPPFTGSHQEVLSRVVHEGPVPPQRLVHEVPRPLAAVCLEALAWRPEQRYPSAGALADEVRRWLADEPVQAYREPLPVRARRWLGRHRTLVTSAVAALVVAVVSLGTATVLLSRANDRERRERDRARANFVLARDAVDRYCTQVSDDPRLKEKDLEGLRRQLLQTAAEFYEKFAEQEQDDPDLRAELGRAYRRLGNLTSTIEGPRRGLPFCERSIAVLAALCAEQPGVPDFQDELAQGHNTIAFMLRDLGEFHKAAEAYNRARDVWQALSRDHPDQAKYAVNLGGLHCNLGLLAHMQGNYEEAVRQYQEAIAILAPIHERDPDNETCHNYLANSHGSLANSYRHRRQYREGTAACREALRLREQLLARAPGDLKQQGNLVYNLQVLGLLHKAQGDLKEGQKCFERALDVNQRLVANHPNVVSYQVDLAMLHGQLALFYLDQGQHERARQAQDRDRAILEKLTARYPEVPHHWISLFLHHNNHLILLMADGKLEACSNELRQARAAFERVARHPGAQQRRLLLIDKYAGIARLYLLSDRPEQAGAHFRWVEALLRDLDPNQLPPERLSLLARAHTYLGRFYTRAGRHPRATAAYRQAIALLKRAGRPVGRKAPREHPDTYTVSVRLERPNPRIQREPLDLSALYGYLGDALRKTGQQAEALAAVQQAVSARQELLRAEPRSVYHPTALANDLLNLADALRRDNQPEQAAEVLRQAADAAARAGRDAPPGREDEPNRARVLARLGEAWALLDRRPQAVAAYRQARPLAQAGLLRHPGEPQYQNGLASVENNLAVLAFKDRNYPQAIAHGSSAIALLDALARKYPETASYRAGLANSLVNRGAALHNLGQADQARRDYRRALALLEKLALAVEPGTGAAGNLSRNSCNLSRYFVLRRRFPEAVEAATWSVAAARLLTAAQPDETVHRFQAVLALAALASAQAAAGRIDDASRTVRDTETALDLASRQRQRPELAALHGAAAAGLAQAQVALGRALAQAGRLEAAVDADRAALDRLASFPATDPEVLSVLLAVSGLSKEVGDALLVRGNLPRAVRAMRARVEAWERLVAARPERKVGAVALGAARADLGAALWRAGRLDAARDQLDQAIDSLNASLKSDPNDFLARTALALALANRAVVAAFTRKPDHALQLFHRAIAIQEKLVAEQPDVSRPGLAQMYANLAKHLLDVNRPAQAAQARQKQIAQLEALPEPVRRQPAQQIERALAVTQYADALLRAGQVVQAEKALVRAQAVLAGVSAPGPALVEVRVELGRALGQLGIACEQAHPEKAERAYRQARLIQEKLFSERPWVAHFAVALVGTYCNTGNLLRSTGRPRQALGFYDRAVRTGHALTAADLRDAKARLFLRNSHWGRAMALEQMKQHEEALADWEQTIRLEAGPTRNHFVLNRALCLARAGRHQRAASEAEKLAGRAGTGGAGHYWAAWVLALATSAAGRDARLMPQEQKALTDRYATQAVQMLQRARAAGWFRTAAAVKQLRTNADLEALRSRADYRKLLEELDRR